MCTLCVVRAFVEHDVAVLKEMAAGGMFEGYADEICHPNTTVINWTEAIFSALWEIFEREDSLGEVDEVVAAPPVLSGDSTS